MFQFLYILSRYYTYYILSKTIYNTLMTKKHYVNNINNLNLLIMNTPNKKIDKIINLKNNLETKTNNNFFNIEFNPFLIINNKIDVYIHIEKLYNRLPIYHIGLTFFNGYKTIRYDYRPFNYNKSYITFHTHRNNTFKNNIIKCKTIYWCRIDYNFDYIQQCERDILNKYPKYILGINDCRHYTHRLTMKTTNKSTPIWRLHKLWKNS